MRKPIVSCDVCGEIKKDSEKWFIIDKDVDELVISRWDNNEQGSDICGAACIVKKISNLLEEF